MKNTILILLFLSAINSFSNHNWENIFYFEDYTITSVDCLDSNKIIIEGHGYGTFPMVFASSNGGEKWNLILDETPAQGEPLPDPRWLWDVAYTSDSIFYLSYDQGYLKKTTNMGKTFDTIRLINNDDLAYMKDIFMLDDSIGINGYFKYIWVTTDGWETWRRVLNEESHPWFGVLDFWMFSENDFCYTDDNGYFWRTKDAGETWEGAYFDKIDSVYPGMFNFCFVNDSIGYMVGGLKRYIGDTRRDLIWKTTDGGLNWDLILNKEYPDKKYPNINWNWGLQNVAFKDELKGIAVGQFGKVLSTTDGGKSWVQEFLIYNNGDTVSRTNASVLDVDYAGNQPIITAFADGVWKGTPIPTGINRQIQNTSTLHTYPNPSKDYIYFEFPPELHGLKSEIKIFDINGNLVTTEEITIRQGTLKFIHEIKYQGTYFWQIEIGQEVYSGKFIVE